MKYSIILWDIQKNTKKFWRILKILKYLEIFWSMWSTLKYVKCLEVPWNILSETHMIGLSYRPLAGPQNTLLFSVWRKWGADVHVLYWFVIWCRERFWIKARLRLSVEIGAGVQSLLLLLLFLVKLRQSKFKEYWRTWRPVITNMWCYVLTYQSKMWVESM